MGVKEIVAQLKEKGVSDDDIVGALQNNPNYGSLVKRSIDGGLSATDIVNNIGVGTEQPERTSQSLEEEYNIFSQPQAEHGDASGLGYQAAAGVTKGVTLNALPAILKKFGLKFPEPQNTTEQAFKAGGNIAGSLMGYGAGGKLIGKGISKVIPSLAVPSSRVVGQALKTGARTGIEGGILGAATTPEEGGLINLAERGKQAVEGVAIGAPLGVVSSVVMRGLEGLNNVKSEKSVSEYLKSFRENYFKAKSTAVEKFGEGLDAIQAKYANDPKKLLQLTTSDKEILKEMVTEDAAMKSFLNNTKLGKFVNGKKELEVFNVKEWQNMINELNSKISDSSKAGITSKFGDRAKKDLVNTLKMEIAVLDPKMAKQMNFDYSKWKKLDNELKRNITVGKLRDRLVGKGIGDEEIMQLAREMLPPESVRSATVFKTMYKAKHPAEAIKMFLRGR